jgi:ribosome-associated heat shock protein Hsp15
MQGQRLDKWIWCARIVRTRSLAASLIAAGKFRVNGERVRKCSRRVRPGDVLTGMVSGSLFVVRVIGAAERRGPAGNAAALYQDLTPVDLKLGALAGEETAHGLA